MHTRPVFVEEWTKWFTFKIVFPSICGLRLRNTVWCFEAPKSSRISFKGVRAFRVEFEFEDLTITVNSKVCRSCDEKLSGDFFPVYLKFVKWGWRPTQPQGVYSGINVTGGSDVFFWD